MIVLGVLLQGLIQGLIQGQPTPEPQQPKASPRPVAAPPLLRPDLEKTPLSYFSDYWKQLGERARQRLVLVDRNATPGLVVARDLVVAPLRVADTLGDEVARQDVLGVDPAERELAPRLAGVDPTLGIALLAVPEATAPVFTLREAPLAAGQLVAAVSIRPDGAAVIAPGHVMVSGPAPGSPNLLVSLELPRGFGSAAVVDLDGRLAGVALEDGAGLRVHAAPALIRAVQRLQHDPFCSAVQVGALDAAVRRLLGTERGVLVESVVAAAFVPGPSLRTGDVLLDWGGQPVSDPATFQQAYRASPPGELVRYRIIRNGAVLRGATRMPAADCRPVVEQPVVLQQAGLALRQLHGAGGLEGLRVLAVRADASAAAAGLREGDVVVSVGPGAGSASAALRTLESYEKRPRPLLLRVQRDGVLRLVALGAGS